MKKSTNTAVTEKKKCRSRSGEIWNRLKKNKGAMIGLGIIVTLVIIAICTSLFLDYNTMVVKVNIVNRVRPPSITHLFGTDDMGRDILWRTLYGAKYSLIIGFGATAIGLVLGVFLGALAGYYGGIAEDIIMRATDILASIPAILLGMVIVCVLGTSLPNLLLAVGITAVPGFIRITRSTVLTIRNQEYIEAAKCIGTSNLKIIFTQVIPNGLSPIIVVTSSRIGSCTVQAAGLSFLGFGVPAPAPEWGSLISLGRNFIRTAPWMTLFPGIFIILMVLAFNILGDGLRDALDPKLKR